MIFDRFPSGIAPVFCCVFALPAVVDGETRPSDRQIAAAVEKLIKTDVRFRDAEITVSTMIGTVTLRGSVSSFLQKHDVERLAKKVTGVDRVINALNVEMLPRRDEDVAFDIRRRLEQTNFARARELTVDVARGEVTIKGRVETWAESRETEETAREVRGVTHVRNELTIGTDQSRADLELQATVQATLQRDKYLADFPISVAVRDAQAVLAGQVLTLFQMDRAKQEALSVNGIQGVDNRLEIVSLEDLDPLMDIQSIQNERLEEAVYRELVNNLGKDLAVASITAVDGGVRLRGTVPSMYHSQRAESTSRNVVGVRRVDNQLTVNVKARPDGEILHDVQFGLNSDATLRPGELTVQVQQGAVTLSGEVQDFLSKSRAARIAGRVHGVRSINNEVKVAWSRRFSDDGLAKRIQERFAANGQTGPVSQHIQVRVEAGRVTLTGQVDRSLQRSEAERVTLLTDGVRSVENHLTLPQSQ